MALHPLSVKLDLTPYRTLRLSCSVVFRCLLLRARVRKPALPCSRERAGVFNTLQTGRVEWHRARQILFQLLQTLYLLLLVMRRVCFLLRTHDTRTTVCHISRNHWRQSILPVTQCAFAAIYTMHCRVLQHHTPTLTHSSTAIDCTRTHHILLQAPAHAQQRRIPVIKFHFQTL